MSAPEIQLARVLPVSLAVELGEIYWRHPRRRPLPSFMFLHQGATTTFNLHQYYMLREKNPDAKVNMAPYSLLFHEGVDDDTLLWFKMRFG